MDGLTEMKSEGKAQKILPFLARSGQQRHRAAGLTGLSLDCYLSEQCPVGAQPQRCQGAPVRGPAHSTAPFQATELGTLACRTRLWVRGSGTACWCWPGMEKGLILTTDGQRQHRAPSLLKQRGSITSAQCTGTGKAAPGVLLHQHCLRGSHLQGNRRHRVTE